MKITSFPAISKSDATVLVLGTMPSVQSLALNEYYGHTRNNFWKILFTLFNEPIATEYSQKKNILLHNKIALWDVLHACERKGSLDSAISKEVPNDFETFLQLHPNITHVFFNGQKAAAFFKKHVRLSAQYVYTTLPSTSPANAGIPFEQKVKAWEQIRQV